MMENTDPVTGIRYGVISANSLSPEVQSEIIDSSTDTVFEDSKKDFEKRLRDVIEPIRAFVDDFITDPAGLIDDMVDTALDRFGEDYQNDSHHWYYEKDGYILEYFESLNAWYVVKSPYVAYTRRCSPCCPGAGDLDTPVTDDKRPETRTYALDETFFDDEKIPYSLFSLETGKLVVPKGGKRKE